MDVNQTKNKARNIEENLKRKFEKISTYLYEHPELGGQEVMSAKYLVEQMRSSGFKVTFPYGGEETGFRAEIGEGEGPTIGLLAEYDALPGYGMNQEAAHACGHNWISAATAGTAIVLSQIKDEFSGKIVLIGTPAEETYKAKIGMLKKGCFADIDVVLQPHLEEVTDIMAPGLAMDSLEFRFKGKAAHAASYPHEGVNALDAVQLTFAGINALRQQVKQDVRIHGIITDGGQAINIVPASAVCKFYVRAKKRNYLNDVTKRVIGCAKGAAQMTGAELEILVPEAPVDDIISIPLLREIAESNLKENGICRVYREGETTPGSSDIGNVSHVCPTLYMEFAMDLEETQFFSIHQAEALAYVNAPCAFHKLHQVINAMVGISLDLYENPNLVVQAKEQLKTLL